MTTTSSPPSSSSSLSSSSSSSTSSSSNAPIGVEKKSSSKVGSSCNLRRSLLPQLLRFLLVDLPLILIFAAYVTALTLEFIHDDYLVPLKNSMQWTDTQRRDIEITSYHYQCTSKDIISATSADELLIDSNKMSTNDAVTHMNIHGASLYPNILSNSTAHSLRQFILEENTKQEGWFVINNKNRYSWGIEVDQHPSVALALEEIAFHPFLRPILDKLVGTNPAVIEFTAITSTYGAETQNYHQDVVAEGSAAKYARSFIPSYSLFIPLQDTTTSMGATEICPGTQLCGNDPGPDVCLKHGFSVAANSQQKWPKGWGALVNQQTTHRGTAHTAKWGLDRVVFILTFAPRPQYSLPGVVESRLLGQSGSYSLHWKQWGHTLDDFGAAPTAMKQPYRTLRSLGIYKPLGAQWGWDIVTVALMRMANGDNGYVYDSLEEFVVTKGGFAPYLPKWLQAPIQDADDYFDEEEEGIAPLDGGWHDFLFQTFQNVKDALKLLNQVVVLVFAVVLSILSLRTAIVSKSPKQGLAFWFRNTYHVFIAYGCILGMAWILKNKVISQSYWAKHIRNGKLFQPYGNAVVTESIDMEQIHTLGFTLPNKRDVLVASHVYQSKYLAAYSNIVDYNQLGNKLWANLVQHHSTGFAGLTLPLQYHLCQFLVDDIMLRQHHGRILYQSEPGRWVVMNWKKKSTNYYDTSEEGDTGTIKFCQKQLMMDENPLVDVLLTAIDQLQTETKFGTWRNMAIHKTIIPTYLNTWMDRILQFGNDDDMMKHNQMMTLQSSMVVSSSSSSLAAAVRRRDGGRRRWNVVPLLTAAAMTTMPNILPPKKESRIPSTPKAPRPPFRSAWFEIGDVVEGKYQGAHNEWYKGIVLDVSVDQDTFDVEYDDGEEDYGLCRVCVRPFRPYRVGEIVEARVAIDHFERVEIVAVHHDDDDDDESTYAIHFLNNVDAAEVFENVPASDLRRFV